MQPSRLPLSNRRLLRPNDDLRRCKMPHSSASGRSSGRRTCSVGAWPSHWKMRTSPVFWKKIHRHTIERIWRSCGAGSRSGRITKPNEDGGARGGDAGMRFATYSGRRGRVFTTPSWGIISQKLGGRRCCLPPLWPLVSASLSHWVF